jgi:predicted ATP-dependent endonuclease of OLD family
MIIDSITIENFRSFNAQTPITELDKINVFIGSNGSGKTNIIQALYLFKGFWKKEYESNFVRDCVFDHQYSRNISLKLQLSTSEQESQGLCEYFLSLNPNLKYSKQNNKFLKKVRYSIKIHDEQIIEEILAVSISDGFVDVLMRKVEDDTPNQYSLKLEKTLSEIDSFDKLNTMQLVNATTVWKPSNIVLDSLIDKFECKLGEMVRTFFEKFHWYFASRSIDHKSKDRLQFLFGDGRNIKGHLMHLYYNEPDIFKKLKKIASEYLQISDIKVTEYDVHVQMSGLTSWFDLTSLSAGEVQLLILLDALMIHRAENIYFIEEPEVHVHSDTQKNLMRLFLENSKESQFFITTHSPNFVKLDGSVKIYSVTKNEGHTQVESVHTEEEVRSLKDQMGIDILDALQLNYVLFVEGESEKDALRKIGEFTKYSVLKFIPIIPYEGNSKFLLLTEFVKHAHKLGLFSLVIADGHDEMRKGLPELERTKKLLYKIRDEDEQLEEQFNSKTLVEAMNTICNRYSSSFTMSEHELDLERDKRAKNGKKTNVAKILSDRITFELDKTELAKELACIIKSEIEASSPEKPRKPQKFEEEVDQVMEWLGI